MAWNTTLFVNGKHVLSLIIAFTSFIYSFSQNPIVAENALPGNPYAEWGVPNFRDNSIAGFSTKMSLNSGEIVRFKINVQGAASFTLKIYRLGYYGGNGARLITNLGVLPGTIQPAGISDPATGLLDCSNWSESASWNIPAAAVSGLYIAKLERTGGGSNHIAFIVRNDSRNSDIYLQIPDATWQAYNGYGGNSLYDGNTGFPGGHAAKVSYNRPIFPYNSLFNTDGRQADWYMNADYPMIRFLERNGYDITYTGSNDVANNGSRLLNHKIFISNGHDEYWSKEQRNNVEAARNAGVHLAFFSGNEVYWKTRWENHDGTEHRTLVCYKEGLLGDGTIGERVCQIKCDASSAEWTGLWRTGGNYDAGKPENALSGQISWVDLPAEIGVPAFYKKLRFWRNTPVQNLPDGQTAFLGVNTLGFEWNFEQPQYASSYPACRITMSSRKINDHTHKLSLYRHTSGALVFGAGTIQWAWGLDANHLNGTTVTSPEMQQATVNLFADMGVQPATLQAGLVAAVESTDLTAPSSVIQTPAGSSFASGTAATINGTASDAGGGVVAGVEVSVDGGTTWRPADINTIDANVTWTFTWTPKIEGNTIIKTRSFDDSGNKETPGAGINVIISPAVCPCTVFVSSDSPFKPLVNDGQAIEPGMKFRSNANGFITGIRFYKGAGATGTHTGSLWNSGGQLLSRATFVNETASGWQQVLFSSPIAITANTTYVVSYHSSSGDYAVTNSYFTQAVINGPLKGLADGEEGPNGVFVYTASPAFPTTGFQASNYWVDAVYERTKPFSLPVIKLQPAAADTCAGKPVSFYTDASGTPAPTVQWQSSTNGTNWTNIPNATNDTFTFVAASADNNKLYRAAWTNSAGTVYSDAAKLTVYTVPSAPVIVVENNCGSSILKATRYTGSLKWNTGETNAYIVVIKPGVYTVTQTVNSCTSAEGKATPSPKTITISIESDFNSRPIAVGNYIWFSSVLNPGDFNKYRKKEPINVYVTNGHIRFKANGKQYNLAVPDSKIKFDPYTTTASSKFVNNRWETTVPFNLDGDVFMTGLTYRVPANLPGNIKDIKWTANVGIDKEDASFTWKWAAAVYSRFADHAGIQVKAVDGWKLNIFSSNDDAGTPLNFKQYVIAGARGRGYRDYTGDHTKKERFYCKKKDGHDDHDDDDKFGWLRSKKLILPLSLLTENDSKDKMLVQVTPNPSTTYFNLTINNKTQKVSTVTVLNLYGQVIEKHEKVTSNTIIKIGEKLDTGIYLAVITQGDQQKTFKIIKVK